MNDILLSSILSKPPGTVITFYSFKGGVGRSMALANIAVLLARAGKEVLCIDWDLEAPGLDRYFLAEPNSDPKRKPSMSEPTVKGGLLDILINSKPKSLASWKDFVRIRYSALKANTDEKPVHYVGSGENSKDYAKRLYDFSWKAFFEDKQGEVIIENLRMEWKRDFDFVLIDSRTGLTDSSGVCTIQMPDLLILLFAPNNQSIDWCVRAAGGIRKKRDELPYDRKFLPIVPVLARFSNEDTDRAGKSMDWVAKRFKPYFDDWLPSTIRAREMVEWLILPHSSRYSFEEALAVEDEPAMGAQGLVFYYQLLSRLILKNFQDIPAILPGKKSSLLPSASELRDIIRRNPDEIYNYKDNILARQEESPTEAAEALEALAQEAHPAMAVELLEAAIGVLKEKNVAKNDELFRLMGRQGDALAKAGHMEDGECLHNEAMRLAEEAYGKRDIRTAQTYAAFAAFLVDLNRKDEAAIQYKQAVDIYDEATPSDRTAHLRILEDLRSLYYGVGQWGKMVLIARKIWEMLGKDGSEEDDARILQDKARALDWYATARRISGNYRHKEVVMQFEEALAIEKSAKDKIGPTTKETEQRMGRAYNNLALALRDAGQYGKAEILFRDALEIDKKHLRYNHPETIRVGCNLAALLSDKGDYAEAIRKIYLYLDQFEKTLGKKHLSVARAYRDLAWILYEDEKYEPAKEKIEFAIPIRERAMGKAHPEVARDYFTLGLIFCDLHDYPNAETSFRRALKIREDSLGPKNSYVGMTLICLARSLSESGKLPEAEPYWKSGLDMLEYFIGPDHPTYNRALWRYAEHLERKGNIPDAKKTIEDSVAGLTASLGFEHPITIRANNKALQIKAS